MIHSNIYVAGQRLPSYRDLASEHGVSLITIRRAIKDLIFEGVVEARHGSGLYVATPKIVYRELGGTFLSPLERTLEEQGYIPSIQEISTNLVLVSDVSFCSSEVFDVGFFYKIERINLADSEPISYDCMWVSQEAGKLITPHLQNKFIFSALAASGVRVLSWDYQISSIAATEVFSSILEVPTGFPLIKIFYIGKFASGKLEIYGETIARSDRFIYSVRDRPVSELK